MYNYNKNVGGIIQRNYIWYSMFSYITNHKIVKVLLRQYDHKTFEFDQTIFPLVRLTKTSTSLGYFPISNFANPCELDTFVYREESLYHFII